MVSGCIKLHWYQAAIDIWVPLIVSLGSLLVQGFTKPGTSPLQVFQWHQLGFILYIIYMEGLLCVLVNTVISLNFHAVYIYCVQFTIWILRWELGDFLSYDDDDRVLKSCKWCAGHFSTALSSSASSRRLLTKGKYICTTQTTLLHFSFILKAKWEIYNSLF